MKELKEIVSLINRQGIRKLDVLTPSNKTGLMYELFEGVQKGNFKTDEEAIAKIYGDANKKGAFVKLKNRLKNQLLNTILFADEGPGMTDNGRAFISCHRQFSIFNILVGRGGNQAGFSLGKRILKLSMKYEFTDLNLMISARMRKLSERIGDRKKFNYYNDLVHKYQKLQHAELLASEYEESITIHFAKSRSAKTELAAKTKKYTKELKKYTDLMESTVLYTRAYNIYVLSHEVVGEYDAMRKVCEEAIAYFENKKPRKVTSIFIFLFKSLPFYRKTKDFEKGEVVLKKAFGYITNKLSRNHFITVEEYIVLSFTCLKYEVARDQYYKAINEKGFSLMLTPHVEHWKIYEAYIEFLELSGQLEPYEHKRKTKFRLGKFLNELPTFSKDKMGFNASVLIIQFLFLLQMKKNEMLIDRAEGLRIYAYRYLRKPETMRSFYFVKMLLEIIAAQFHKEAVVRKSEKYYKKMTAVSTSGSVGTSIVEIIPYENMWQIVLTLLESKIRKPKRSSIKK